MKLRAAAPLVALVVIAVAAWPAFVNRGISQVETPAAFAVAPVMRDDLQRDKLVAYWETAVRERHSGDLLSPRELAGQYLQRYRERGDIDDVIRARHMAEQSLRVAPHNIPALGEMAAVMLTLHRFRDALAAVDELIRYDPHNAGFLCQKAGLEMELGRYGVADAILRRIGRDDRGGAAVETVRARYDELTGRLARARTLMADALAQADSLPEESAQSRAWYHVRAGELAFQAGDVTAAIRHEQDAIAIFPTYNLALKDLAKFELAEHHTQRALDAATRGAQVTPFAETLGYEADAQLALGDRRGAEATRAVIFAIERLGNSFHVNDRLLAVYYADHHLRQDDALHIAEREAAVRGTEIYAQDTLAWAAAMDGQWDLARRAMRSALRYHTQDPLLQYHAGIIAIHYGDRGEARQRLSAALATNPHFHPVFAADAREQLRRI